MCIRGLSRFFFLLSLLTPAAALAHHGVASLGVAGMEGPGAPLETSSSATLPRNGFLAWVKLDHAEFERYTPWEDDEGTKSSYWIFGIGYGIRSWLSAYVFLPYNIKKVEDGSSNSSGLADMSLMGVLGFKYDEGFRLTPEDESLDDLEDWHFTFYGGLTIPTGDPNVRTDSNEIDPGMSLGFGKPSFMAGLTATKPLTERLTWVGETSYIHFLEYEYDDGNRTRFGTEYRLNSAFTYRLLTLPRSKLRLDAQLEANYLWLGRDETNGSGERATGGHMLYLLPGIRAYWWTTSVGLGVKFPTWTKLNEESEQQGAEGKEDYRLIFTVSLLF
jgi:hypothetical protein